MSPDGPASTCLSIGAVPIKQQVADSLTRAGARPDKVLAALFALVIVAWLVLARTMGGMDAGPGTPLGSFSGFVASWVLMLAAMMLPAELRFTATYARMLREESPAAARGQPAAFVAGYLLVWTTYGAVAWLLDAAIRQAAPASLGWQAHGPQLAGALVASAGAFQFTRWKQACLMHCVSPFGFFMRHWYPGPGGALRLGATHGLYCLGCCWALMAVMFAVGVMSLYWMSLLGLAMFVEKMTPPRFRVAALIGGLLIALGLWIAIDPATVPGLTPPHHAPHMH